jgi:hypothetical protein
MTNSCQNRVRFLVSKVTLRLPHGSKILIGTDITSNHLNRISQDGQNNCLTGNSACLQLGNPALGKYVR